MYRYTNISFPSLGIDIDPPRVLSLGPLNIHMYGLVIACGLFLAAFYGMRRAKQFGVTEDHVLDGVLWVTPFAFVCARAYYGIFSWELYADIPSPCSTSGRAASPSTAVCWARWRASSCSAGSKRSAWALRWIWCCWAF